MDKIINADVVFSKTDFQDDIDDNIYPVSVYECPVCKNKLSFNKQNFEKNSLNTSSSFSSIELKKINDLIKFQNLKEPNSFIDFYCPQCNTPTRIYFTAWAGGRFTGGYRLEFIVIDKK